MQKTSQNKIVGVEKKNQSQTADQNNIVEPQILDAEQAPATINRKEYKRLAKYRDANNDVDVETIATVLNGKYSMISYGSLDPSLALKESFREILLSLVITDEKSTQVISGLIQNNFAEIYSKIKTNDLKTVITKLLLKSEISGYLTAAKDSMEALDKAEKHLETENQKSKYRQKQADIASGKSAIRLLQNMIEEITTQLVNEKKQAPLNNTQPIVQPKAAVDLAKSQNINQQPASNTQLIKASDKLPLVSGQEIKEAFVNKCREFLTKISTEIQEKNKKIENDNKIKIEKNNKIMADLVVLGKLSPTPEELAKKGFDESLPIQTMEIKNFTDKELELVYDVLKSKGKKIETADDISNDNTISALIGSFIMFIANVIIAIPTLGFAYGAFGVSDYNKNDMTVKFVDTIQKAQVGGIDIIK